MGKKKAIVYQNGVYILRTNKKLYKINEWDTSWNNESVGVALVSDNCKLVISKSASKDAVWGSDGKLINGIVTTYDKATALKDYAGESNTDQIVAQDSYAEAALYCRNTTGLFPDGRKGYLGAAGEWQEVFDNLAEIEKCMDLVGGEKLKSSPAYWSSTQMKKDSAWYINISSLVASWRTDNKDYSYYIYSVRAFAPLQ